LHQQRAALERRSAKRARNLVRVTPEALAYHQARCERWARHHDEQAAFYASELEKLEAEEADHA
jgi:hypothetical protein